jgi:hypothetical protein
MDEHLVHRERGVRERYTKGIYIAILAIEWTNILNMEREE